MNAKAKIRPYIRMSRAQLATIVILPAALLLPATLSAQNPEWMLFSPRTAGVLTSGILSLIVGPDGDIWAGCVDPQSLTAYGVGRFDGRKWRVYNTRSSGLPSNAAFPFAFDQLGNTWFATLNYWGASGGSGLVKLNGTNWTTYTKQNSELPSDNIWAGTLDLQGRIWLATGAGVVRFDGQTWTVFNNQDIGLSKNWFSDIAADSQGNIWTGTYEAGGGVAKFDGQTWTAYTTANSGITHDAVLNIVFDSTGSTWIGALYQSVPPAGSLVKFDGQNWTTYTTANSELPGGWGLALDRQGMIWAGGGGILVYYGDSSGGVGKFDGEAWTIYNSSNSGMPAKKVWALAQDSYGNMWMGTESGLVAYREGGVILPRVVDLSRDGQLQMPSEVGKTYQLEATQDMADSPFWSPVGEPLAGNGNPISWDVSMAAERCFYRVKISE